MQTLNLPAGSAKVQEAMKVIEGCRRDSGFHASTSNYPQLWNRDLVYSIDALLSLGYANEVKGQFSIFLKHQRRSGRIPTSVHEQKKLGGTPSFHSWAADTEILFILGVAKYATATSDTQFLEQNAVGLKRCLDYIERKLDKNGLISGMDWRDAMPNYMGKYLLSNQMLLVEMYDAIGMPEKAQQLRNTVNRLFYSESDGFYADSIYFGRSSIQKEMHLDSLGNSLAVLNGTAGERSTRVLSALEAAKTEFGYANISPPYAIEKRNFFSSLRRLHAFVGNGAFRRNAPGTYQNSTIWPFVESRVVQAFRRAGLEEKADQASSLMLSRRAMNEVYGPKDGKPQESEGQLWTAAAIISLATAKRL